MGLFDVFRGWPAPVRTYRLVPGFSAVKQQAHRALITPRYRGHLSWEERNLMATFQLTDSQQVTLSIAFTDKRGNPAPAPAGAISWMVDIPTLVGLTPSADGASCVVATIGPLGTATVSVKVVDATGNTLASGSITIPIVPDTATVVTITPGAPTEQP